MGFALVLRELASRRRLLALGAVIAALAAVLSVYRFEGFKLKPRALAYSAASTQVLVDSSSSVLGNAAESVEPLVARAAVYANFMTNPAVLELIGKQVGLSGGQIYATGPVTTGVRIEQEPTALKRNVEITGETKPYRLEFASQNDLPTINIFSQAPTTHMAVALADAAVVGMQQYVETLEKAGHVAPHARVHIRQLGSAHGAVVNGGISKQLAVIVFVAVFLLWCALMLAVQRLRRVWSESATLQGALRAKGDEGELLTAAAGGEGSDGPPHHRGVPAHAGALSQASSQAPDGRRDGRRRAPAKARSTR